MTQDLNPIIETARQDAKELDQLESTTALNTNELALPEGVTLSDFVFNSVPGSKSTEFKDHLVAQSVTMLFQRLSHPAPQQWCEGVTERYVSDPELMRVLINQRLHKVIRRLDLYVEGKSSFHIRETLSNTDSIEEWLMNLELTVIPFMIDNDLPLTNTETALL